MRLHDIFFWLVGFFLIGVLVASILSNLRHAYSVTAIVITLIIFGLLFFNKFILSLLAISMFIGAGYFFIDDYFYHQNDLVFNQAVKIEGVIVETEQRLKSQKVVFRSGDDLIQLTSGRYPDFDYGDRISVEGRIKEIAPEWKGYFSKERVIGMMSFPKISVIGKNEASPIKSKLFKIKDSFETSYRKVLSFEKAAFMSGLTLGSTAEFSDEFKEKMRLTGTTHLVALSGYNISILIRSVGFILAGWWLTRKLRLPLSVLFVAGFVIMTGAEPSVVRAAVMAMILLLGDYLGRTAHTRNIIASTALIMVLINPKILVFDAGFQLSFIALLGLIYLEPWLRGKFKAKKEAGFLGWRQHFWSTTSAQLAVLPILIYHFGFVSPISIPANVLLLEFIPVTMGIGFFIGIAAFFSHWLSWIIAIPASIFLAYELTIIDIFSKLMGSFGS